MRFGRRFSGVYDLFQKIQKSHGASSLLIEIYTPALCPVVQGLFYVVLVQIEVVRQLPGFGIALVHGLADLLGWQAAAKPASHDILDDVDVAFYGDYKELSEDDKAVLRDMVKVMRARRAKKNQED